MEKLLGTGKRILTRLLPIISNIVPKKKDLWLFGAWQGFNYSDNSKYMFEYILKEHPEIQAIWITRSKSVYSKLRSQRKNVMMRFSLKGIIACLRAEVVFETEGNQDISPFINNKRTKTIQLWHGFPLKALKWKTADGKRKMTSASKMNMYYWISCSHEYSSLMSELLGIKSERFVVTGYPRNDTFFDKIGNDEVVRVFEKHPGKRFIIYMPTHRNFGSKEANDFINIDVFLELDKQLLDNNLVMVYKPHFHELKKFLQYENQFKNILFAKDEMWSDVYSYLHMFDLLVSDYSSVLADFVCADKPVIYFPYDLDDYSNNDAGLCECFLEKPLGPMCFSWKDVIDTAASLLKEDTWKEKRSKYLPYYHTYNDGKNSERVYQYAVSVTKRY